MLSQAEQAIANLEEARDLRSSGKTYREIRRLLGITSGQLRHIRRALKREKAGRTRLRSTKPQATDRDLPVNQSVLPAGLRKILTTSGFRTLGDLADRLENPELPGLEVIPGIGAHKARLIKGLLDNFGLLAGSSDLRAAVESSFPEFGDAAPAVPKSRPLRRS